MSLYDSFFSDINKDHVYNIIKDIVFENHQINIFLDNDFRQIYDKNLEKIFNGNNVSSLDEINKIVVNETIVSFSDKIQNKSSEELNYDKNVRSEYDNLFAERMKQNEVFKNIKENEEQEKLEKDKLENDRKIFEEEKQKLEEERINQERINEQNVSYQIVQHQPQIPIIEDQHLEQHLPVIEEFRIVHKIVSNKRTHVKSSRYNYSFNLKNNNIII